MTTPGFKWSWVAILALAACDSPTGSEALAPHAFEIVSGDRQSAAVATTLTVPLSARVLDAKGRGLRDQPVHFIVKAGGGAVTPATVVSDEQGLVQAQWTLGTSTADSQFVEARTTSGTPGASLAVLFRATALAASPVSVGIFHGDHQDGEALTLLRDPIAVIVKDPHGNPVAGATVSWQVTGGGGSNSSPSGITNTHGVAQTQWTLGNRLDVVHTLSASAGSIAPVTFTATPHLPDDAVLVKVGGDGQVATAGNALAELLTVRVLSSGQRLGRARGWNGL